MMKSRRIICTFALAVSVIAISASPSVAGVGWGRPNPTGIQPVGSDYRNIFTDFLIRLSLIL